MMTVASTLRNSPSSNSDWENTTEVFEFSKTNRRWTPSLASKSTKELEGESIVSSDDRSASKHALAKTFFCGDAAKGPLLVEMRQACRQVRDARFVHDPELRYVSSPYEDE